MKLLHTLIILSVIPGAFGLQRGCNHRPKNSTSVEPAKHLASVEVPIVSITAVNTANQLDGDNPHYTTDPDSAGFIIHRAGNIAKALRLRLHVGGSAKLGEHYTWGTVFPENECFQFKAGESETKFVVVGLNNHRADWSRWVIVSIEPPTSAEEGYTIIPSAQTAHCSIANKTLLVQLGTDESDQVFQGIPQLVVAMSRPVDPHLDIPSVWAEAHRCASPLVLTFPNCQVKGAKIRLSLPASARDKVSVFSALPSEGDLPILGVVPDGHGGTKIVSEIVWTETVGSFGCPDSTPPPIPRILWVVCVKASKDVGDICFRLSDAEWGPLPSEE